jgi:sugar-specific transcriptional regulator TrmB
MLFLEFGFNYYEDKALEAVIRESLTVKELIKKTNIPPGKVYSVLKSLSKRGIISVSSSRPQKYYIEAPAKLLSSLIEQKQSLDEDIISKARLLASSIPKNEKDYFIKIGTTREDNKEIQLKIFRDAKVEVLQILNSLHKPEMNRAQKEEWENAIKDAINRGVKFRALYHTSTKIPENILKLADNKRQSEALSISDKSEKLAGRFEIRRTTNDTYRIDIVDNKKVLLKIVYDDPLIFGGLIFVENEKLAKNLKLLFEDMWKKAK